ncbi:hypothetical protein DOTSEDRAFT_28385 [Lecanosticta acicola]|uniref:Ubiquitin-like domain-containing protein n=1 Tax=Lecanosticta acicola TaxID=111012 RepID=A0AAI8YTA0_9PEZI|nr:hypothetical protein DOTSEDRAFT_28385 [Lecanosticta acicola]
MALFKPPSWAKQRAETKDEGEKDLFSHSSSFLSIQEESIARQKRRAEKAREKEEVRKEKEAAKEQKHSRKRKSEEAESKSGLKNRRINAADGAKLLAQAGLGNVVNLDSDSDEAQPIREPELPVRRSPRSQRTKDISSPAKHKSRLSSTINIQQESDDDLQVTAVSTRPAPPTQPDDEEDSDPELDPELAAAKRRARAKARLKEEQQSKGTPDVATTSDGDINQTATPPAQDPPVQIYIYSPLPNTTPLIVYRKLSQTLQPVKDAWLTKQDIDREVADRIFLTHCGRRLWDTTTVKRLGLDVDSEGRVFSVDDRSREGVEKVAVVAVTPELFEQMKEERAKRSKMATSEFEPEVPEADAAPEEGATPQEIRLIVKAKDKPEWKVKVTSTTLFSKILRVAKKNLGIPPEQEAYLEYDGDRLDPEDEVGSTDIEDLYRIELYLSN